MVIGFYRTCVIDAVLEHSPAEYVRRPTLPPESPTLGLSHLQFEAMLATARSSGKRVDFALVAMLGLLGLRIFEACRSDIADLGEEHGHRVLRVSGKGGKVVLVPLPPAVGRAVDTAAGERSTGPILLNRRGNRMDRHAATRRLKHLAAIAGVRMPRMHPHISVRRFQSRGRVGASSVVCPCIAVMGLVPAACNRVGETTGGAAHDERRGNRGSSMPRGARPDPA